MKEGEGSATSVANSFQAALFIAKKYVETFMQNEN